MANSQTHSPSYLVGCTICQTQVDEASTHFNPTTRALIIQAKCHGCYDEVEFSDEFLAENIIHAGRSLSFIALPMFSRPLVDGIIATGNGWLSQQRRPMFDFNIARVDLVSITFDCGGDKLAIGANCIVWMLHSAFPSSPVYCSRHWAGRAQAP